MSVTHAICRLPAPSFADGMTTARLGAPCYETMCRQHDAYVAALRALGPDVTVLDALPDFPDAHFVEDVAVVLPHVAVITRPGAAARRGEEAHVVDALGRHRPLATIRPPGTLDGGDVLCVGRRLFVGISARTNDDGAAQLGTIAAAGGLEWEAVPVGEALHLKSSVNRLTDDILVVSSTLADHPAFASHRRVVVDPDEAYAANALAIGGTVLVPSGFARTRARIERIGLSVVELDMSESRKMDGGLTCLSLRIGDTSPLGAP